MTPGLLLLQPFPAGGVANLAPPPLHHLHGLRLEATHTCCHLALQILSGGAVLVDLPGVRDANEARGAVAEAYMRRLHSVWVVADINRAVSDKTAKVRDGPAGNEGFS